VENRRDWRERERKGVGKRFLRALGCMDATVQPQKNSSASDPESVVRPHASASSRNRWARWIRIHRCLTFEGMGGPPINFSPNIKSSERLCRVVIARSLARRSRRMPLSHPFNYLRRLRKDRATTIIVARARAQQVGVTCGSTSR
jgi:hypothetical protein